MFQDRDTSLHIAARQGHGDIVDVLLKYNADPHKQNRVCVDVFPSVNLLLMATH